MSDIQEQVEQFRIRHFSLPHSVKPDISKEKEFHALLRSVVEEGLTIDGAALFILAVQHIKEKREKFAWLLEK